MRVKLGISESTRVEGVLVVTLKELLWKKKEGLEQRCEKERENAVDGMLGKFGVPGINDNWEISNGNKQRKRFGNNFFKGNEDK